MAGFKDDSFGKALPHLYSHRAIAELLSEKNLDEIAAARLLGRVRDLTRHSQPLFRALSAGASAATVPSWAESQNNVQAAQRHFLTRLHQVAETLTELDSDDRAERIRDWLEEAAATQAYVEQRMRTPDWGSHVAPAQRWLDLFELE